MCLFLSRTNTTGQLRDEPQKKTFWLNLYSLVKEHLKRFRVQTQHRRLAPAMPLLAVYRSDTLPTIYMMGTPVLRQSRGGADEVTLRIAPS